jgi:hypothetical protein
MFCRGLDRLYGRWPKTFVSDQPIDPLSLTIRRLRTSTSVAINPVLNPERAQSDYSCPQILQICTDLR